MGTEQKREVANQRRDAWTKEAEKGLILQGLDSVFGPDAATKQIAGGRVPHEKPHHTRFTLAQPIFPPEIERLIFEYAVISQGYDHPPINLILVAQRTHHWQVRRLFSWALKLLTETAGSCLRCVRLLTLKIMSIPLNGAPPISRSMGNLCEISSLVPQHRTYLEGFSPCVRTSSI